jgi:hypothetical protein
LKFTLNVYFNTMSMLCFTTTIYSPDKEFYATPEIKNLLSDRADE